MTGGGFDIIHPGHVETLERARALGDVLVVSVARNATFERNKKRKPIHDETMRRRIVASMRAVDAAVLGSETDIFETVQLIRPDIIALGYDQAHSEKGIKTEVSRRGLNLKVVRLQSTVPEIKTSRITETLNNSLTDT
ncbi:MAG: FAD synthase [Nitrososphaerota archaeon]|nr:FAD synthase [Nitrososphaerota archaeon]